MDFSEKRFSLKEILLRNKEEKRRKKNESSRRSYNKLHKSAKEKVHSESCEAKRKRKLRQETKQKIDEQKLKHKSTVKRHRGKIKISHEKTAHARVLPCNSDVFRNRMEKSRALKKLKESLPSKRCAVMSTYLSRRSPESPIVLNLRKSISPVDSVIASNIQEIVESAKLKRSKEALTVMNTVTASVSGENLEKSRCKIKFANNWVFRPGEFQAENESKLKY
jgi:HSP90 family molecular chaperone